VHGKLQDIAGKSYADVIPSLPEAERSSELRFSIARLLCDEPLFSTNATKGQAPHTTDSPRKEWSTLIEQAAESQTEFA